MDRGSRLRRSRRRGSEIFQIFNRDGNRRGRGSRPTRPALDHGRDPRRVRRRANSTGGDHRQASNPRPRGGFLILYRIAVGAARPADADADARDGARARGRRAGNVPCDVDSYPRGVFARAFATVAPVPVPYPANARTPQRRRMVPVKVEPKTFFANERTLLQWLSMSILLLFMSLALLSLDAAQARAPTPRSTFAILARETNPGLRTTRASSRLSSPPRTRTRTRTRTRWRIRRRRRARALAGAYDASALARYNRVASGACGAILAPIAVAFMVYALATYVWRSRRIARREPSARYDDVWGPVALTCALVTVSTVAVALAVAAHPWR